MDTRTTFILCFLIAVCEGIDLQAAGVAATGLASIYRPTPAELGFFFSGSTVGLFFGALWGGWLADRIGRTRVLVVSVLLFGVFSLLTPVATDMNSLSVMRVLTGLGLGGALPNLIALVSESAADDSRTANVAAVYSGAPFGGAVASAISLALGPDHWRWIFIIGGVAPLLLVPALIRMLPESPQFIRLRDTLHSSAASGSVASPRAGSFIALFTEGRGLRTLLLWSSFFLGILTLYLLLNWLPTLLRAAGISGARAAGVQIAFNLGGALSAALAGRLLEGRTRYVAVVVIFVTLPIFFYALAKVPNDYLALLSTVSLLGCAVLAAQAFFYSSAPATYPTRIRGLGVGAAVAMGRLGSIAGPLLGGVLTASGKNSSQLLMSVVPLAVVGSVFALLLAWRMSWAANNAVPASQRT